MTSSPQLPSTIPWALSVGADELDGTHTPHWLALDDPRFHEHAEIERVLNPAALTGGSISPSVIPLTGNMISPTSPPGTPPTLAGTSASATPVTPPPQVSVESEYTDEEVLQDTAAATVIGNGTDGGGLSAPPGVAAAAAAAVTALDIEMDMSEIFDYDHFMGSQVPEIDNCSPDMDLLMPELPHQDTFPRAPASIEPLGLPEPVLEDDQGDRTPIVSNSAQNTAIDRSMMMIPRRFNFEYMPDFSNQIIQPPSPLHEIDNEAQTTTAPIKRKYGGNSQQQGRSNTGAVKSTFHGTAPEAQTSGILAVAEMQKPHAEVLSITNCGGAKTVPISTLAKFAAAAAFATKAAREAAIKPADLSAGKCKGRSNTALKKKAPTLMYKKKPYAAKEGSAKSKWSRTLKEKLSGNEVTVSAAAPPFAASSEEAAEDSPPGTAVEKGGRGDAATYDISVSEHDIYGYKDPSKHAQFKRQVLLDLGRADMDRINKERDFFDKQNSFESSRSIHTQILERCAKANECFEAASKAASVPLLAEVRAREEHKKASCDKRVVEAGVKNADNCATLAQARVNEATNTFGLKVAARAQAGALLQAFDRGMRYNGVGDGEVAIEGSSGERKRRRYEGYAGKDEVALAGKNNEEPSEEDGGKENGGRLHRRPTSKVLADAEATGDIARGIETERALRLRIESHNVETSSTKANAGCALLTLAFENATSELTDAERAVKDATIGAEKVMSGIESIRCAFNLPGAIKTEFEKRQAHQEAVKTATPFIASVRSEVAARRHLWHWSTELMGKASRAWQAREAARVALNAAKETLSQAAMVLAGIPGGNSVDISRHSLFKIVTEDARQGQLELEGHHMAESGSGARGVSGAGTESAFLSTTATGNDDASNRQTGVV